MRTLKVVFIMCIMLFAYNNVKVNAQAAARAGKVVKELIKGSSKAARKNTKVKSYKAPTTPKRKIVTIKCPTCKGEGKVNVYNPYTYTWEIKKCIKCNGLGRIQHNHY